MGLLGSPCSRPNCRRQLAVLPARAQVDSRAAARRRGVRAMPATMRIVAFRGKYAAEFTENGKRRRRSLGTDDPGEVEPELIELGAEIEARSRPAVVSIEFAWRGKRESLGARPSGRDMDVIWRNIGPFFGSRSADTISEELC